MYSNTQDNTNRDRASTGNAASGLRDNVPSFSSQNPSSGFDTRTDYSTGQSNVNLTERQGTDSGTNIANTGYNSSPLGQQYDQGTTTAQYDPSRFGGEGTEGGAGQKQYGGDQGIGTGVGHHESAGSTYLGQGAGVGGGDMNTTSLRPAEQTTQTGDTTGLYAGDTTTGSGIGTDNQYPAGHHHHHHVLGHHRDGKEVTGSGDNLEPSMTDKVVGGAKKVAGKVTSNNDMYQQGKQRAAGYKAD